MMRPERSPHTLPSTPAEEQSGQEQVRAVPARWRWDSASAGRVLVLIVLALVTVLVPLRMASNHGDATSVASAQVSVSAQATARATSSTAAVAAPASASPRASATPTPSVTPPPVARRDADGMPHTDVAATGVWQTAPAQPAPAGSANVRRYLLRVEEGTGIDPVQVAPVINGILNDSRGWPATLGVHFEAVTDPGAAQFTLSLATPPTVNALCAPMNVRSTWSCRNGATVNLNSDRWNYLVPWIPDATTYRSYLVNHEVGHWLGYGHLSCQGPGLYAPVMMQQSKGLGQCVANPWSSQDNQPAG